MAVPTTPIHHGLIRWILPCVVLLCALASHGECNPSATEVPFFTTALSSGGSEVDTNKRTVVYHSVYLQTQRLITVFYINLQAVLFVIYNSVQISISQWLAQIHVDLIGSFLKASTVRYALDEDGPASIIG